MPVSITDAATARSAASTAPAAMLLPCVCRLSGRRAQDLLRYSPELAGVPLLAALDAALHLLQQDSEEGFQVVGVPQDPLQRWLGSGPLRDWQLGLPVLSWEWQQGWGEGGQLSGSGVLLGKVQLNPLGVWAWSKLQHLPGRLSQLVE